MRLSVRLRAWRPLDDGIRARFAAVTKLRTVEIVRFGRTLDRYTIYLAQGFVPAD